MVLTSLVVEDKSEAYSETGQNPMDATIQDGCIHFAFASQAQKVYLRSLEVFPPE
jgi:hypothetical protein